MENKGRREEEKEKAEKLPKVPKKKRKTEPEVIIAPTQPGGPDISVE
ncbi:MAG TPA: hypothetical protein VI282_03080 [Verrucomicrobiae bacterium]|jgi:hypothetical protein